MPYTELSPVVSSAYADIIPFRAAHLPRHLPARRDAASPCFFRLASHPKVTHRPGASRRRGETPHLLELSLIAICDRASNGKQHNKLRRFAKRLRYRCGRCVARLNRPHRTRRGGLSHKRRWSFQLRHTDAARRRISLCRQTAQRPPSQASSRRRSRCASPRA